MIYRYRFISEHRATYGVQRLCRILGVRRQGFYRWLATQAGRETRAGRDEDLAVVITGIHQEHRGRYGRPRITMELRRRGITVNHKRVGRVMAELGLAGITRRRRRFLTSPALVPAEPVADLVGRDFTAERPGERLVGDITCLVTGQGRLFLATVIDLHNREVVGHALGTDPTTSLVTEAIDLAAARGLISDNAVFHSDRGTQYTAHRFRDALTAQRMRPSIGRKGSCYDNAVAEAFFATLKTELPTTTWTTRDQARTDIFSYIHYYNHDRLHSTNGHRTPAETRTAHAA
ncbi:IS3 family transposase [Lentzea sp. PSKA42]|uniref:IS3 family transposase n=1 Tax=Lentzea indica TaxID=2604800 RepID=A0ABX1G041_9PSEU|nr:IS3 family transposase [Lentzea indica]NKE64117.1 IS3 family transposase [Lentzea indica]